MAGSVAARVRSGDGADALVDRARRKSDDRGQTRRTRERTTAVRTAVRRRPSVEGAEMSQTDQPAPGPAGRSCSAAARSSPWTPAGRSDRRRRPRRRRADRGRRARPRGARGHPRGRRRRRHRDARHDRHPPAHVADRDARLRRRLDPDPVLRLVLPRARQGVPAARTSTPATCCRRSSRSTPASRRPWTGRTGCRPSSTPTPRSTRSSRCPAGSSSPTATSRPGRGSGRPRRSSATSSAAGSPRRRHARLPDGLRRHRRPGVPRAGRLRGRPRARRAGHHARRRLGRHQRRRHPAHVRERLHDARRPSTCTPPP